MGGPTDDERTFEALMNAAGVRQGARPSGRTAPTPPRPASDDDDGAFAALVGPGVRPLGAPATRATKPLSAPPKVVPSAAPPPEPRPDVAALQAALTSRERELAAAVARATAAEATAADLQRRIEASAASLAALQQRFDAADHERRALARQRPEAPARPSRSPADVLGALSVEPATLLAALLPHHTRAFVAALTDGDALEQWLDAHVALTCDRPECRPRAPVLRVAVDAVNCQVCGGSDIARAWATLRDACAARGVTTLGVVGGSPAYHAQLEALARKAPGLRLRLVDGTIRHTAKDAQPILACDAVVIWCSTELNHAATAPYAQARRVLHIPVRGVARMLRETAQRLSG